MTGHTPQSIRVLVIEDKEDDFAFVRLLLSRKTLQNYQLTWAPTFEAGREMIAKGEHDVALCDHNLGLETGVDLIKFATATGVTMPIILLTGADNLLIDQEAAASGAADYLSKASLDTIHLERSIRYALKHAEALAERRRLEKLLLKVSDKERRRIGADLHDDLGQYLTGVACLATALRDQLPPGSPQAEQAGHIAGWVNEALDRTRSLARGLYPVKVEQAGLDAALQDLSYEVQRLQSVQCRYINTSDIRNFDAETSIHLYRIAQEAIHNAVRHGSASEILVRLEPDTSPARLVIEDNGKGFDPVGREGSDGLGLHLMRHRSALINGSFRIERRRPEGMMVECVFPGPILVHET
jgi:signal transduction histidine kinase